MLTHEPVSTFWDETIIASLRADLDEERIRRMEAELALLKATSTGAADAASS